MKKRKIFDIEKIGFGDEEIVSPSKSVSMDEVKQQVQPIIKPEVKPVIDRPQVILSHEIKMTQEKNGITPTTRSKDVKGGTPKTATYKPVEFVSPISGRRVHQPKTVHLAHGKYQLSTATFVSDDEQDGLEQVIESKVVSGEEVIPAVSNEELHEMFEQTEEVSPCPSFTTEENTSQLGEDEKEVDRSVSEDEEPNEPLVLEEEASIVKETPSPAVEPQENTPLKSQTVSKVTTQELGLEDVFSLLEEEEQLPSIFDSILAEGEAQEEESDCLVEETNHRQQIGDCIHQENPLFDEEENSFEDENFCNELLEQVQIVEDKEEVFYYETPSLELLNEPKHEDSLDEEWILGKMDILERTFLDFGVRVRLTGEYTQGPTVTQIEIQPESGTKLNKIIGLSDDLKLSLSVEELRIEPIPGKNTIGVEIPNPQRKMVYLKEILSRPEFILHESPLYIGLGQDISGHPVYADIAAMPHGLIAGQTGSGKSVCINTLLISMLYKASPDEVRVMLIDPKRVELAPYNAIPHLITPVICDEHKAAQGLRWAVEEMERRYDLFLANGVKDIKSFNERRHQFEIDYAKLPYILIVIDELADLMMVAAQEVEDCIMRITQKARAAGIHMIVATQRPTVDVITGTIKSNIPSRIAFTVAQANDSRVILDENGAQNLLGQGDMLFLSSSTKTKRVQGAYISSDEIDRIVDCVKGKGKPKYLISDEIFQRGSTTPQTDTDPLLYEAMNFIFDRGYATASSLQTRLRIGFNRAARIIDTLELNGWIGNPQGAQKQREIKISREEFESLMDQTRL